MLNPPLVIIIATCGRHPLLNRLLDTLAVCQPPPNELRIIIAENGEVDPACPVIRKYAGRLPIEHHYTAAPNKSIALNETLAAANADEFAIFFDDDVRVHPRSLTAYADAIRNWPTAAFFGGKCLVDYEAAPEKWLLPYLPASAKGWSLGQNLVSLQRPHALGFNWSARVSDLLDCGGFKTDRGPGTSLPVGEETDIQQRLMGAGVKGYYLPDAVVSHYVPRARCNERWALQRALQCGFARGLNCPPELSRIRISYRYRAKLMRTQLLLAVTGGFLTPQQRFHHQYWKMRHSGLLAGLKASASQATSCNVHAA